MKILIVVHTSLPKYCGGVEVLSSNLANEFAKKNHQIELLYCDPFSDLESYTVIRKDFPSYIGWEIQKNVLANFDFGKEYIDEKIDKIFEQKIQEFQPDIIHFHHLIYLSANLPKISKKYDIPVILTLHDFWFQCPMIKRVDFAGKMCDSVDSKKCVKCAKAKNTFGHTILKTLRNILIGNRDFDEIVKRKKALLSAICHCDLVIAPTRYLFDEFKKWGIPKDKFIYSADGIDDTYFSDIEKTKSKKFRFTFIGAIIPEKGLHILIDAFNKLNSSLATLFIYGYLDSDPKYAGIIKKKSMNNPEIIFKGTFPHDKIGEIYRDIDCLVLPSVWAENSPLVVKNALLSKTPVVASDIPGVRDDIKDGVNGLLFKMGSSDALFEKLIYIMDKKVYDHIKNNISKVKTVRDNASELLSIYQKLLNKKNE